MKTWQITIIVILAVVVTALVTASALVLLSTPKTTNTGAYTNYPYPTPTQPTTAANPPVNPPATGTLTINNAVVTAQNYLIRLNNLDLAVKKVEEYSQNFYVQVYERSTGAGAFELVIDKYAGSVYPESGPAAIWNTKYGTANGASGYGPTYGYGLGGEMGRWGGTTVVPTTLMPVTPYQVAVYAQQYLSTYYPGTSTGNMTTLYGYYTVGVYLAFLRVNASLLQ